MAHIAMTGVPPVSHVLPSLEILRELVSRGHRVTYANDPAVADLVTETGAELLPYASDPQGRAVAPCCAASCASRAAPPAQPTSSRPS